MKRIAVLFVIALGLIATAAEAQQAQPSFGCLQSGNCGQKGNSPSVGPRHYWQNWVCQGCHLGPPVNYAPSPVERSLVSVPTRFWVMHADAARDGETRARITQHPLLPASRMSPLSQALMAQRPPPAPAR